MPSDRFVHGFPRYRVTDRGRVYRAATGKTVRPQTRGSYLRVRLFGPCERWHWVPVHVVVLTTFVGPRPSKRHHGAHKNGRRTHNWLSNLAWKTPKQNEADKRKHGTQKGGGAYRATSTRTVKRIRARHAAGESFSRIARRYGLHRHSVARIVRGLRRAPR